MPSGSSSCSGTLYQVEGPLFFGVQFNPSKEVVTAVGSISVAFSGNSNATMTYTVNGVGRTLALPESHQLWSAGGGVSLGGFTADVEGAVSRLDRNTFSTLDDLAPGRVE